MGGRVVDGTGLENRHGGNVIVGSNPTPSASFPSPAYYRLFLKNYTLCLFRTLIIAV